MPQIKGYSQRTETIGPMQGRRVSGDDLGAGSMRALASAGNQLSNLGDTVYKNAEQTEITDAAVKMSAAHAELTTELNAKLKDGTINSQEFMENYDKRMGDISGEYFTSAGKDYFRKGTASLRSNLMVSATTAQAEVAGAKAVAGYQNTEKNFTSVLINDPSSHATAKQLSGEYLDGLVKSGNLDARAAEKLKIDNSTNLAKAAVRGWINLNPVEAQAQLTGGHWDTEIDGDTKKQLFVEADMAIRGNEADKARAEAEKQKAVVAQQKVTQNDFINKLQSGQLSAKEILNSNLDAVGSGSKEQFLDWIDSSKNGLNKTNPAVLNDLFARIHLPDGDPRKITSDKVFNDMVGEGITTKDLPFLRKEIEGADSEEGRRRRDMMGGIVKTAEAALTKRNPMIGFVDMAGEEQMNSWRAQFMKDYEAGRAAGKSDEQLLLKESPDYIGKSIMSFKKSPQQILRENSASLRVIPTTTTTLPQIPQENVRKSGESIDAWKARTKKASQ